MEIIVTRHTRTTNTTIGDLSINGLFFCNTLEDVDRGLTSEMTPEEIVNIKVHGQTAIPTGRYEVVSYFSPKHQKQMPLLKDVPGFEGVEIHVGNTAADTDGCLLLGSKTGKPDFIAQSRDMVEKFYRIFFDIADKETVYITYK